MSSSQSTTQVDFSKESLSISDDYNTKVKLISKYFKIKGKFELKNGRVYTVYNNLNPNKFTWNEYDAELKMNSHDMLEL